MPEQGATYTFEDLSGGTSTSSDDPNPYNALISACHNDPVQIQDRYSTHRTTRASQQRALLLSPSFPGVNIDPILRGILRQADEDAHAQTSQASAAGVKDTQGIDLSGAGNGVLEKKEVAAAERFVDHRHNLTLWARPPKRVREMVGQCQRRLRGVFANIWLMPLPSLHMTALEFTHSQTPEAVDELVRQLMPIIHGLVDFPHDQAQASSPRRVRLVKPMLTYDAAAVALSFLPAAGEPGEEGGSDDYGYHHLRASLWDLSSESSKVNRGKSGDDETRGVEINTRYIVPSAHLTIARFVTARDTTMDGTEEGQVDGEKIRAWVQAIEECNEWLEKEYWPGKMEWVIGEEKGLDFRKGACWYGGGETVTLGRGIAKR